MTFNAYDYAHVHKNLGIDVAKLGCVMMGVEPLDVHLYLDDAERELYYSKNPARHWIKGAVGADDPHVTLLYGLLDNANSIEREVHAVLDGWSLPEVQIEKVDFFPSTFKDEPYACVIGKIKKTPELLEAHQRLSLLPHINTFPEYTPHVTLAYVHESKRGKWVNELGYWLDGRTIRTTELDLGRKP